MITNVFNMKSPKQIITTILGLGLGLVLERILGVAVLIFLGAWVFGLWFGKWYISKNKKNKFVTFIAWSNLVSGILLPPLGILTASATYSFFRFVEKKEKGKYRTLWIIGALISIVNAIWGIYQYTAH